MQALSKEKIYEWQILFEEREKSKLLISEFCRQKKVSSSKFYYYQDLIKHPDKIHEKKAVNKLQKPSAKRET